MFEPLDDQAAKSGLRPRRWSFGIGMLLVAILIFALVLVPKLWPSTIKQLAVISNQPLVAPHSPPHRTAVEHSPPPSKKPPRKFRDFVVPTSNPRTRPVDTSKREQENIAAPPKLACANCQSTPSGNGPGFDPNGQGPGNPAPGPPVARLPEPPKPPPQPIRVGGRVQAANRIGDCQPAYPQLAKQARIQGTVRFTAIIGKDGIVRSLELVSGHPLLVEAARQAMANCRYRPTQLNGEPVEVIVSPMDATFRLGQ